MSPQQSEQEHELVNQQSVPQNPEAVQTAQPSSHPSMDPQKAPAEQPEVSMRGGDERGGCCPGRFCFIPCPIPINCFIIPCPC